MAVILTAMLLAGATCGRAADLLESSRPGDTEVVERSPGKLYLTFTEPVLVDRVEVLDAQGRPVAISWAKSEDDTQDQEVWLTGELLPGRYELSYHLLKDTIHKGGAGTISFSVRAR